MKSLNLNSCVRKSILTVLATLVITAGFSQQMISESTADTTSNFPLNFVGHWKGELKWIVSGKPVQRFQMQLIVKRDDSTHDYTWQIIYGDQGKDNRPYRLKSVDATIGHWIIDEQNGILLDGYVHGQSFHGAFTVGGNTIVDNYRVDGYEMFVEFFTILLDDKTTTGKNTKESPRVFNYRISGYQLGVLRRVK